MMTTGRISVKQKQPNVKYEQTLKEVGGVGEEWAMKLELKTPPKSSVNHTKPCPHPPTVSWYQIVSILLIFSVIFFISST